MIRQSLTLGPALEGLRVVAGRRRTRLPTDRLGSTGHRAEWGGGLRDCELQTHPHFEGDGLAKRAKELRLTDQRAAEEHLEKLCGLSADRLANGRMTPATLFLLLRIYRALLSSPKYRLMLGSGAEAEIIRGWLQRRTFGLRTPLHAAVSILPVAQEADPLSGSRFATLRRMDRKAKNKGITCQPVAIGERAGLLDQAAEFERSHPDLRYRNANPLIADLPSIDQWLVARSVDGEALTLSVTPISGNTAMLRYLKTISSNEDTMLARYAMTAAVIRMLFQKQVEFLVDNISPLSVSAALRQFATRTGFRIARAQLS